MASEISQAALEMAGRGFALFPVYSPVFDGGRTRCSCGEADCSSIGKHPRNATGFKAATTDPSQIARWWSEWSDANVGIATGAVSGFAVLDVDPRHGGDKTLEALIAQHGPLPPTVVVHTGGGGEHYYFRLDGLEAAKSRPFEQGLDFKGNGGYVVAPPSRHMSGSAYVWREGCAPGQVQIAAAPEWLVKLVLNPRKKKDKKTTVGQLGQLGQSSEGGAITSNRNVALTSIAGTLRRRGMNEGDISHALQKINVEKCSPPLDPCEVDSIAESIAKYPPGGDALYEVTPSGIERVKQDGDRIYYLKVANFHARIVRELVVDDGVETRREFEIEARVCGTNPTVTFTVPAEKFGSTNWWTPNLGAKAVVFPGFSSESHLRAAIQLRATEAETVTSYLHTGWREIDGKMYYLHCDGGIGEGGNRADLKIALDGPFQHYRLASPPSGKNLSDALHHYLSLRELAPAHLMVPLMAAPFAAVLGGTDYSVHIAGFTGTFKSETATIIQSFFGSEFSSRNLPASWSSTANALEEAAFRGKDAILVIDDFKPSGDSHQDSQLHNKADRVFRAAGNGSGRGRMSKDGGLRAQRPPRCLVLSTGEDVPSGQSLRARVCILELKKGDVDKEHLTACQEAAVGGAFAGMLSAFCAWAAPQLAALRARRKKRSAELRAKYQHGHGRLASMLADLHAVWEIVADFMVVAGEGQVLKAEGIEDILAETQEALTAIATHQAAEQNNEDPVTKFLAMLQSVLGSGKAHIAGTDGREPNMKGVGWREEAVGANRPMGDRIGWTNGVSLFLEPIAAYTAVNDALPTGQKLPISETTLRKRLAERGLLERSEKERGALTVRTMLDGARRRVLQLSLDVINPDSREEEIPV